MRIYQDDSLYVEAWIRNKHAFRIWVFRYDMDKEERRHVCLGRHTVYYETAWWNPLSWGRRNPRVRFKSIVHQIILNYVLEDKRRREVAEGPEVAGMLKDLTRALSKGL